MTVKADNCKKVFIAPAHGFCNGVRRALKCVHDLLPEHAGKLYIYNEIVHNTFVVNNLKNMQVKFASNLEHIPPRSTVVWSAHGVPPQLVKAARAKDLHCVDATCPLVQKLHDLAARHSGAGDAVIFIGHRNHPETIGVLGCGDIVLVSSVEDCRALPEFDLQRKIIVLTQTTLCSEDVEKIVEVLKKRYPQLELLSGICYATNERQQSVKELVKNHCVEHILVIGSPNSSNSRRLCETAEKCGVSAQLIDDPQEIADLDLSKVIRLGITSGASAPEELLLQALEILQKQHNFEPYEE